MSERNDPIAHECRVIRRLEARGETGLGDALIKIDGSVVGDRFRIESLYAVGSEGAVFLASDLRDPGAPLAVAKLPLLPLHRPFDLTDDEIRRRRESLREEAANLARAASPYMPASHGLFEFANPALDADWGGEFGEPEPCLVMEKLPGFDLDLWLARMHSSTVPKVQLRRQLEHVAIVVLSGLMDLQDRGYYYTDLRPGNVRIRGRSRERVRLMDAGSLVRTDDRSGKFPHVPAYLPPELFESSRNGDLLLPSAAVQAVMAGRTLFEVATGRVPLPGEPVEASTLYGVNVSPSVAETIDRLCRGSFPDVTSALAFLSERFDHDPSDRAAKPRAAGQRPAPQRAEASQRPRPTQERAVQTAQTTQSAQSAQSAQTTARKHAAPITDPVAAIAASVNAKPGRDLHSFLAEARNVPAADSQPAKSSRAERPASMAPVRAMPDGNPSVAPAAARPRESVDDDVPVASPMFEDEPVAAAAQPTSRAAEASRGPVREPSRRMTRTSPSSSGVPLAQAFANAPRQPRASLPSAARAGSGGPSGGARSSTERNLERLTSQRFADEPDTETSHGAGTATNDATTDSSPSAASVRLGEPTDPVLPPSRPSAFQRFLNWLLRR
ncbi:MAG: hypothetical protein K8T90_12740 [Planctomycetes bacterium]|nr:hypothetical protein [Planctomycetota bacterium]